MPEEMCLDKITQHHKDKIDYRQMSDEVKQEHQEVYDFLVFLEKQLTN